MVELVSFVAGMHNIRLCQIQAEISFDWTFAEIEEELEGARPAALCQRQDLLAEVGLRGVRRRPRRRRPSLRLGSGMQNTLARNGKFKDISQINAYFRQIFVNRWRSSIFAKITLALLFLLKQWALQASNHRQLSRVLFNEPGKVRLYCPICCPAIQNL